MKSIASRNTSNSHKAVVTAWVNIMFMNTQDTDQKGRLGLGGINLEYNIEKFIFS